MDNKKKIIGTIALGGLMLGAPFAAFAFSGNSQMSNQYSDEIVQDRIADHSAMSELRIEHMNEIINALLEDDSDLDRLKEIVEEFIDLELTASELDLNDVQRQEMRDVFFEFREDSRELGKEFRNLIEDSFSEEELTAFGDEHRADMEELGLSQGKGQHRNQFDDLSSDERETIREEMGWSEGKGQGMGKHFR
ncbi:MAG: hypothetical protein PF569_00680 [Candidatus Woesearchaeota archaeon]|jgi:hypothetical protein|nr:hypothetical protein [Candidatus Woesearchaeota archaeon]